MLLARVTNASLASPISATPERSPLMSAAKTGTPALEKPSARTCRVTVLPVPVAPVTRPCRLANASVSTSGFVLRPTKIVPASSPTGCASFVWVCSSTTSSTFGLTFGVLVDLDLAFAIRASAIGPALRIVGREHGGGQPQGRRRSSAPLNPRIVPQVRLRTSGSKRGTRHDPKKPAPDLIWAGNRFSEKIVSNRTKQTLALDPEKGLPRA